MNIWMLNHYATPPDTPGITRHYDFARELIKHGHKVTIFASSFEHRTRRDERIGKKQFHRMENIDGVEFAWLRTAPYHGGNDWRRVVNMLSYAFGVVPLGLNLKEKPQVILASSPHPFAGLAGWLLARFKGAEFIFEVRDLWPLTLIEIGGYSRKSPVVRLLGMLEKFLYKKANRIIVLHPKADNYITKLGISADKIVHIPNGVSPELFLLNEPLPPELEQLILNLKASNKTIVLYTGAHGAVNALDTILEAARSIQGSGHAAVHFLLVGDGPEKDSLIEYSKKLGLNNIDFHGSIPKITIPGLLRKCDIGILTWRKSALYQYGMSINKLWDYMMSSMPVAWAIDTPVNPVEKSACGITVPPEDPQALAEAILKLCNMNKQEWQEMGMRGHEYVLKYHSTPVLAGQLLEVMLDICAK